MTSSHVWKSLIASYVYVLLKFERGFSMHSSPAPDMFVSSA